MSNKFCTNCGAPLDEGALFCTSCGAKVEVEQPAAPANASPAPAAPAAKGKTNTKGLLKLGIAALAFILSFVMLILVFCPVLKIVEPNGIDTEIKIKPLHNIVFMFDAMQSKDYDDLEDTALYDRYEDVAEDFYDEAEDADDYDDLSAKGKRLYSKLAILNTRMELKGENVGLTPAMLIAAILTLVYIVAAIALFVLSAWYLLAVLFGTEGIGEKIASLRTSLGKIADVSADTLKGYLIAGVCALPMLLISLFAPMFMTFDAEALKCTIAGAGVWIIVLSGILFAAFIAEKALAKEFALNKALIARVATFVLALLLTIMAFTPALSTKIEAKFNGRDKEKTVRVGMSASILSSWYLTRETKDTLKDQLEDIEEAYDDEDDAKELLVSMSCPHFEYDSSKDVKEGYNNVEIGTFLLMTHVAGGYMGMGWIFGLVTVLNTLVAIAGCVMMWYSLVALAGGKKASCAIKAWARRVGVIAAIASLVLVILFSIMTNSTINKYLDTDTEISVGVAAGIIFMVIFALINLVFPKVLAALESKPAPAVQTEEKEPETVQ